MKPSVKSFQRGHKIRVIANHSDILTTPANVESCLSSSCIMMRVRRQKRCYIFLLTGTILLSFLYFLGYSPILFGGSNEIKRPSLRFEETSVSVDPNRPRIMVTWYGRMGNHMFQYSSLIGVAKRNNMTPIIPPNIDILDVFNLPTLQGDLSLLRNPISYPDELVAKYDNKTEHLVPNRDAFLDGYHQSWKYYENVKEELRSKHFVFHKPIMEMAKSYIQSVRMQTKLLDVPIIGVHVRRGDFVRQRIKGFTAAPIPFYYKAMNYFRRKYKRVLFIMCTNDIFWAEDHLDKGPDIHYSTNTDGAVDLAILTTSDHVIITSGSFSWWAGYLVRGEVIYYGGYPEPNTRIGNMTIREDYYPPWWIPMI